MILHPSAQRLVWAGFVAFGLMVATPSAYPQTHMDDGHMVMDHDGMKPATAPATGTQFKLGDLVVTAPWSRATPNGAKIGVGYLKIQNDGQTPDKLVAVTTDIAGRADVHEMSMNNGVMQMRPLSGGVTIEPGKSIELGPSGFHLMLMDLKKPLRQGDSFDATLRFEKAGSLKVTFKVGSLGAAAAPK